MALYGFPAFGAVRDPYASEQQPEVVVDFCDGADSGAWVVACAFLLDGDCGGESGDFVDVGFFLDT